MPPFRSLLAALAVGALAAPAAGAQAPLPGYAPASAARQRALETSVVARPDSARAHAHARALSAETHVAGSEAQARTRDYVIAEMKKLGLQTEVRAYRVWLPHATGVNVWAVRPRAGGGADSTELPLAEPPVPGDAGSRLAQYPTVNGSSAAGDAHGEVVYVNYGLIEDYAQLDSMKVSVRGKVVLARYGRSFRGIKAREAEKRGAVALLIYSDPADDGYVRGDTYPEGPMRPPYGVQRGSVFNGNGDPSTPGWPSTERARRLPADSLGTPRIPVVPIGYANARVLLDGVRGADVPQAWQGGLPLRYHAGPGPARARVRVTTDAAQNGWKTIWNTYGTIRGSEQPDELVMVGAHRDGWGPGAGDNVSGTVSVLEAARAVMEEVRAGRPPKRTLVFATWDAEEWGLVGSTEYVEDDSLRLTRHAVAYLNQDVSASGPSFGGGGSPSLRATLRDVARVVPDPSGEGSVYAVWRRRSGVADGEEPAMGDPGGGSDFAGFYNHLGIPHADWGFGGAGGVYHSQYDTYDFVRRFADPTFAYHAAAARVNAALLLRLANADVLPYDYVEFARTMRRYLPAMERTVAARRLAGVTPAPLAASIERMERAAQAFAEARDAALAASPPAARLRAANEALKRVEKALTRPQGLRTRPWFRNLVYAADENNGYANVVFPSVSEAVRDGDAARATAEITDLAGRFDAATRAIEEATAAVRGR
ncbi:M20/M25/M40 family metallo-hydrolase [Roseisolibacter sp. H3M3-2]|uniref:M20/M25/M40 family metallo-hydrolase n=1 Tax=Roseisolibacter sp. H3M3-2 TaxID=3031323 RepID=UPI0023DC0FE3|nr:M20/M25/M40 family metallo-hydrolase [Roseisolibacter sp. H3M3-2]MDF1505446.1 M20/M25/M40 family metallo-hydrolase [Roseisolibacter sp. H3M3-2]